MGDFKNNGREWHPQGEPEDVRSKDFPDKQLGKVAPYGVYDLTANEGWVSVGIDHDTARFATESLHRWWQAHGLAELPPSREALGWTADSGGSNGSGGLAYGRWLSKNSPTRSDCAFPCVTSLRAPANGIRSNIGCFVISRRIGLYGKPLVSRAVIVNLIGSTKTRTGLQVRAELDTNSYEAGIKVSDEELAAVHIHKERFHYGDWNYTIIPRN